ncbi:MAG: autotransporter domain-containing protein [Alphaproteobacteria bacterium]|nr:autotransporter domain-containing protein [Alphaproteobacteria bacterium]
MSNTKHLADLLKVCSILPALAIMPAMADVERIVTESGSELTWTDKTVSDFSTNPKEEATWEAGLIKVSKGSKLTIEGGSYSNIKSAHDVYGVGGVIGQSSNFDIPAEVYVKDYNGNRAQFKDNAAYAAGGAMWLGRIAEIKNADFIANSVYGTVIGDNSDSSTSIDGGGALFFGSSSVAEIINSGFEDNSSTSDGGAISMRAPSMGDNSQAKLDIFGSEFKGNIADMNGGAIYSTFYDSKTERNAVYVEKTDFEGNSAVNGGAIYNDGVPDKKDNKASMKIVGGEFEENTATNEGGAIFNKGNMTVVGAKFDGNIVAEGYGGAIKNNGVLVVENSNFEDNLAYVSGAFATSGKTGQTTITGGKFSNNHATADGGALGLYLDATVTGVDFENNTAGKTVTLDGKVYEAASNANGGGALYAGQKVKATLTGVRFLNNESGVSGGAVSARHNTSKDGSYLKFETAEFVGNKAAKYGGAMESIYDGEVYFSNAKFYTNSTGKLGGAIYNGVDRNYYADDDASTESTNHGVFYLSGNNEFVNNTAGELGGAIYNDAGGTINFAGTNVFSGNVANGLANDIHNMGTLNITGGTTSFDGGVTGTGTFTLASDAILELGTATIKQGTIDLYGTVVASMLNDSARGGSYGRFIGDVTVGDDAMFELNVGAAGTYNIWDGKIVKADQVSVGDIYEIAGIDTNGVKIVTKSVADIAETVGISTQAAGAVAGLANANSGKAHQVSLALQDALDAGDVEYIEHETKKLNPTEKPVAQAAASSVQNQVLSLTSGRMAGGISVGRAGGDERSQENGFWIQGLFNKSKFADDFHGYTRGVALGADTLIDNKWTIGGGLAFNNSDVHADGGAHTDISSKTLFLYGQYKPNNWFVNATATYSMSEYTENKTVAGVGLGATYDVDAYGAQIMTGYDFTPGITTEAGLRYLHVAQDDYIDGRDAQIMATDTDFLTGIAGLKYAFAIENDWAIQLRPELRAAMTYDFISDDAATTVVMPGVEAYAVNGERLSRMGGEFGIGLTALYKGMEVSLMYDLDLHKDYTSQTGMIKFRGRF